MLTMGHNLRHSLDLLRALMAVHREHDTYENREVLRLAREEFEELNDVFLRITGERSPWRTEDKR